MASEIAERLRLELQGKGWKQADLARAVGVTPGVPSRWLSGQDEPTRERIPDIAGALGVQAAWLAGYGDREPVKLVHNVDSPEAALLAGGMLDWVTAFRVLQLLTDCPEAQSLDAEQRAEAAKRLYFLALKQPARITPEAVVAIVLSQA